MTGAYAQWLLRFSYFALRGWFVLLLDENSICFFFFRDCQGPVDGGHARVLGPGRDASVRAVSSTAEQVRPLAHDVLRPDLGQQRQAWAEGSHGQGN